MTRAFERNPSQPGRCGRSRFASVMRANPCQLSVARSAGYVDSPTIFSSSPRRERSNGAARDPVRALLRENLRDRPGGDLPAYQNFAARRSKDSGSPTIFLSSPRRGLSNGTSRVPNGFVVVEILKSR